MVLAAAVSVLSACQQEDLSVYDSTYDAVRFDNRVKPNNNPRPFVYSKSFSFVDQMDAEYVDIDLNLLVIGRTASYDRSVNYVIDEEGTTAPEGSYEILASLIPANQEAGYIRIRLKNLEALKETDYALELVLAEGGDLPPCTTLYDGIVLSDIKARLTWGAQIPLPSARNYLMSYNMLIAGIASYASSSTSVVCSNAMMAIVNALGWDDWDDADVHGSQYNSDGYKYLPRYNWIYNGNLFYAYQKILADWLQAYKDEHDGEPLLHNGGAKEGTPVQARIETTANAYPLN